MKSGAGGSFSFSAPVRDSVHNGYKFTEEKNGPFHDVTSSLPRGHFEHLTRTLQVYFIIFPGPRTYWFVYGSSCL